jgi:transcriptional regulator with XRE-family HTH domain
LTDISLDQDIDLHIGQRLRARRRLLGLSQPQLAEAVGVRFQQIQKYECGEDRISASRLWRLSGALKTPVNYFFEGLEQAGAAAPRIYDGLEEFQARQEALDLARSFQQLGEQPRRTLLALAKSLNGQSPSD